MQIRVGFDMVFECPHPVPMVLKTYVHPSRAADLVTPDVLVATPTVPMRGVIDPAGNRCARITLMPGQTRLGTDAIVLDSGQPDEVPPDLPQTDVRELPEATLDYLVGSRYCEIDRLMDVAWSKFGGIKGGRARVQAICDFVHDHIAFGYPHAKATMTAWDAYEGRKGVCRDFAHLAVTLCRCLNIPARYCNGYMGDIGVPQEDGPGDFNSWFEAYLGDSWYTFDARYNSPRIGRVLIARGRDAADVAIAHGFGLSRLAKFKVWTDEIEAAVGTNATAGAGGGVA